MLTALAVGLITSFALSGFALASLLEGEPISEEGRFARPQAIRWGDAAPGEGETRVRVGEALLAGGGRVTLVVIDGVETPAIPPGQALRATPESHASLTFEDGTTLTPLYVPLPHAAPDWWVVRAEDWERLAQDEGKFAYRLVPEGEQGLARVPGVSPFIETSGREIGRDLFLVVAFCCTLVGLFSYEFMRSEVRERRAEFAVWRSLGMRRRDVVVLVVARALATSVAAVLLGLAVSFVSLKGAARATDLDRLALPEAGTAVLVSVGVLLSALVGGIVPARAAAKVSVREAMEGGI